jgi:hypothetical protein
MFRGFTTRTSRAQYYAVVLYGLHLADVAIGTYGYPSDDKTRKLSQMGQVSLMASSA